MLTYLVAVANGKEVICFIHACCEMRCIDRLAGTITAASSVRPRTGGEQKP